MSAHPSQLFGKTVVLTRRPADVVELTQRLIALGAQVCVVPSLATETLPESAWQAGLQALPGASCVAFASRTGVDVLAEILAHKRLVLPEKASLWAVGPSTAARLSRIWPKRHVHVAQPATADALAVRLCAQLRAGCDNVVLPCAQQGRTVVVDALRDAGIAVCPMPVYSTRPTPSPRPVDKLVDYVVFTSPSSVAGWLLGGPHPKGARCISIGPTTSRALRAAHLAVDAEARAPSIDGLVAALTEICL